MFEFQVFFSIKFWVYRCEGSPTLNDDEKNEG